MFVRLESSLPPDPTFEADLTDLGYFINKFGQIRLIDAPDEPYYFNCTNNERVNEVRQEAMQMCAREEAEKRMATVGLSRMYFPEFNATKPDGPHIAILVSQPEKLKMRKRVVVLINDSTQDLGILSYQKLQGDRGLNGGSVVSFMKEIITSRLHQPSRRRIGFLDKLDEFKDNINAPGLIVMNTGQMLYSHKFNETKTMRSWSAMPRKSIVHDMIRIHEEYNRVENHRNPQEHIKTVFDDVLLNADRVSPDAEIYVVGIEDGGDNMLRLLNENFHKYGSRITALALVHPTFDSCQIRTPHLEDFLYRRTRQWKYSNITHSPFYCTKLPDKYETYLEGRSPYSNALPDWSRGDIALCPSYGGGEDRIAEFVFTNPSVQKAIMGFFARVSRQPKSFRNGNIPVYPKVPDPTVEDILALSVENDSNENYQSFLEQIAPKKAQRCCPEFFKMNMAFLACPTDNPLVAKGRKNLWRRIVKFRAVKLQPQSSSTNDNEAKTEENWPAQPEGPKVKIAGTTVDAELLKAADKEE